MDRHQGNGRRQRPDRRLLPHRDVLRGHQFRRHRLHRQPRHLVRPKLAGADGNPANLTAISCAAAGLCAAIGDWDGYRYSVGTWAQGILVQDNYTFAALSCPAVDLCKAVDNNGNVYTFTKK